MNLPNKYIKDYRKLAHLLKNGITFTAFDTETTGLNSENCRIIEIGAVKFNYNGIVDSFNSLINPLQSIPYECSMINHITDKMVINEPTIDKVLPNFIEFLSDSTIIGHNVNFDLRFLKAEMERLNKKPLENWVVDTLSLCRWAHPDWGKYNQPLIAQRMGIEIKDAHRAYDDAFVCGNIFLQCIKDTISLQKF